MPVNGRSEAEVDAKMRASNATEPADLIGEGFVGVAEAARFLGLSRSKLYDLMDSGEIVYAKFGRSRRVPRKALLDLARRSLVCGM
jgi:excisionase family DNA binding protein